MGWRSGGWEGPHVRERVLAADPDGEGQDQRPPGSNSGPDGMQKVPPPGLGTAGDWLDRNFGGGAYGPPGTSGTIVGGASAIAGFAPVAGEIQDAGQVVTGRDANGNPLSTGDRVITGVAAVVPIVSGPMLRWGAKKVIKGLAKAGQTISAGAAGAGRAMTAGAGAVKGFVRKITGGAAEQAAEEATQQAGKETAQQAGKQAAEEAAQQAGKETAQQAAKEIAEETGEQAAFVRKITGGAAEQAGKEAAKNAPRGILIGSLDELTEAEKGFVEDLLSQGKNVEVAPGGAGRTPDFKIDGIQQELKTRSGVAKQTPDGLSAAMASRVMDGRGQATQIVVDARGQAGMTQEVAERGIGRAYGADNKHGGKIQSIRVIGNGFDITVPRAP